MKYALRNKQYAVILLSLLLSLLPSSHTRAASTPAWAWPDEWLADSAFFNLWSRPDAPVAMQAASRSWLWGPVPFAVANEPYAESPTNLRLVEYLDKGRMEINDPTADRSSPWFVTSGLLVNEMVTGQYQTGNSTFQTRPPADIPVAGDDYSPEAPTYASFATHTEREFDKSNRGFAFPPSIPTTAINKAGDLSPLDINLLTPYFPLNNTELYAYDSTTGHNIPRVFTDWMAQSGPILENGHLTTSNLIDPLYLLGHPITEPYWASIRIDQKPATVLIQLYERRALTYNPANPPEWQVEMANVGRAYYNWLYRETLPTPAIATNLSTSTSPNSILFHGYNWPPNTVVHLRIALNNSPDALIGPLDITTNPQGRFTSQLLYTPELEAAQKSKADIRAYAESNDISISLPFATPSTSAPIPLSGTIVGIENAHIKDTYTLTLDTTGGGITRIQVTPSTSITFAEGTPARASDLDTNAYISLQAIQSASALTATSLQLLSTSSSHAWVGYKYTSDKKHLTVNGASWPPSTNVSFTLGNIPPSSPTSFATLKTDSRGNLLGTITPPAIDGWHLLRAEASGKTVFSRRIYPQSDADGPYFPEVTFTANEAMLVANVPAFCIDDCGDYFPPFTLLDLVLPAQRGETLTLRTQFGPDPIAGISPKSFSIELYPLPPDIVLPTRDDYTRTTPIFSTDEQPGSPFAFTFPQTLPPGRYVMLLTVTWRSPVNGYIALPYSIIINAK